MVGIGLENRTLQPGKPFSLIGLLPLQLDLLCSGVLRVGLVDEAEEDHVDDQDGDDGRVDVRPVFTGPSVR